MTEPIFELQEDPDYVGLTFAGEGLWIFPRDGQMKMWLAKGGVFDVDLDDENADPQSEIVPDFAHFAPGYCCVRKSVWATVAAHLNLQGPMVTLRLTSQKQEYVLFEPSPEIDCLDFERSDVQYFATPPFRVKWVENVVLRNSAAIDLDIFRLKYFDTPIFCTNQCREIVNRYAWTGLIFKPVAVGS